MSEQQLANTDIGVQHFRILVIGNTNAGKTTILNKVCHAQGREPVYFDANGKELQIHVALQPSPSRGEHEIERQFQYPTAHGFVFHESGFEAGGAGELDKVKDFIKKRAESEKLEDQLHAIWYCITTSNDRGMTDAEMSLFENGTGNVPVIAIFTKMDALDAKARNQLMWEKVPFAQHKEQVPIRAKAIFEEKYLRRLQEVKHQPRYVVQLRDMHKEGTDCEELIVRTSQALNGRTLKLFCLSILRNDVEFRVKDVINKIIIPKAEEARESGSFSDEQAKSLFCDVMYCFPHMLPNFDKLIDDMDENAIKTRLIDFHFQTTESVEDRRNDDYLEQRFEDVLSSMPPQASYQHQAIWIGLMAEAIADLYLFASLSRSREDCRKALDFCLNTWSYPKLTSAVEQESSIVDANVVLDILKENRHNHELS